MLSSEKDSTLCQVAPCHIQDHYHIHSYCCQNLISHTVSKYFRQCGPHATMVWRILPLQVEETAYRWAMMGSCTYEQSRTFLLDAGLTAPTSNTTSNVKLRRVRATIVAVEKQLVLHILGVCL